MTTQGQASLHFNLVFSTIVLFLGLSSQHLIADTYWGGVFPGSTTWLGYQAPIGERTIFHWPSTNVAWYLNQNGAGDGLTFDRTRAAIQNGYDQWDNVSTANISFTSLGSTPVATWGNDGKNVHFWAEQGDPAYNYNGPLEFGHLAVTVITINSSYEIIDADVVWHGRPWQPT